MANEIAVDPRVVLGKQNRRLRQEGKVPAVVYGKGRDSTPVEIDAKAFELLYRAVGRSSLVQLSVGDGKAESAIIKSVQRNPLTGRALHVDFFLVDLTATMEVEIPLTFTGSAPAVELTGGTLLTNLSQVKVKALPGDLPHEISVDVSPLVDLDATIHVRDIVVGDKVQVVADPDELVAKVLPPRIEEEPLIEMAEELVEGEGAPAEGEAAEGAAGAEGQAEPSAAEDGQEA
jgi:large subunit ribosomal protein L25